MSPDARRVYEAIRRAGRHGVCRVDFEPPDVIDGRKPILNFNGRVNEIRNILGKESVRWNLSRRNRCKVWVLGTVQPTAATPPTPAEFTCDRGHTWHGPCVYSHLGYPMLEGAAPCPQCAREPNSVEAEIRPARPAVIERAAA